MSRVEHSDPQLLSRRTTRNNRSISLSVNDDVGSSISTIRAFLDVALIIATNCVLAVLKSPIRIRGSISTPKSSISALARAIIYFAFQKAETINNFPSY